MLSKRDARWLASYERATDKHKAARSKLSLTRAKIPKKRKTKGSARTDAVAIVLALARWTGGATDDPSASWIHKPRAGKPGTAEASVPCRMKLRKHEGDGSSIVDFLGMPDMPPDSGLPMKVVVKITTDERPRPFWITAVGFRVGWAGQVNRMIINLDQLNDHYKLTGFYGWGAVVAGS